jgi:uncharacterized delta-60 repeat protein
VSLRKKGITHIVRNAPEIAMEVIQMYSKLSTRLSRRRSDRTKIILLAAIFLIVVPNYLTGVARASAGDLVSGFGSGGKVITDFSGIDVAAAVAVYPDGRIVLAGTSQSTTENFVYDIALARYNPNGSLDQTFGNGGLVKTDFNEMESASAVAIQPDGKIVVAGSISRFDRTNDFLFVRYNEDGTLDSSFRQDGVVTTDFYNTTEFVADMAITPNGEIVVAGTIYRTARGDFAVARYKSNGDLDETFGSGGKVTVGLESTYESLAAMALSPKGEIVLLGETITPQPEVYNSDFIVVRLNRNGSPDASFGVNGMVITDFTSVDMPGDVALTPDGKTIVVGTVEPAPWRFDFVVARYDGHGNLDPSFGTAGHVITDFSTNDDFAFSVAVRPNGKIVVAGKSGYVIGSSEDDFAVARYERDGTLDQPFGSGGLVTTDFSGDTDEVTAVTILPSGRIIVAGLAWDATKQPFNPSRDFAVADYEER